MAGGVHDRYLFSGSFMLHIHLEDCRNPAQCVIGYTRHGPERVFLLGELYRDLINMVPHADLTEEIQWKDLQGNKITVGVNNQADWNKAVGELKRQQKQLKDAQNETDRACLELFVKVNPLIKVRRVSVTVPTLQHMALHAVASLTPSEEAANGLQLPQLLKSRVIETRNSAYFVEGKFVIA